MTDSNPPERVYMLSTTDMLAQDLLWIWAARQININKDLELGQEVKTALVACGFPSQQPVIMEPSPKEVAESEQRLREATSLVRVRKGPARLDGSDIRNVLAELTRVRGLLKIEAMKGDQS